MKTDTCRGDALSGEWREPSLPNQGGEAHQAAMGRMKEAEPLAFLIWRENPNLPAFVGHHEPGCFSLYTASTDVIARAYNNTAFQATQNFSESCLIQKKPPEKKFEKMSEKMVIFRSILGESE